MFDTLRDNSRIIVYIVVIAFVISGGFMGYGAYLNNQSGGRQAPNQTASSVIAEVNGMEISQQEYFSLLQQQAPQSNLSSTQIIPFRYNVLDALIERKLLMAQAEVLDVKVDVSEAEIDENYNKILEQNDMTDQELADALSKQGYTIGDLREDIKTSIQDSKTITQTIDQGIGEIEVSEKEIEELYQQRYPQPKNSEDTSNSEAASGKESDSETKAAKDERPALSEVKDKLKQEIRTQKRNEALNSWLAELKANADITINDPVLSAYHALENENYNLAVEEFSAFVEKEDTDPIFYSYLAQAYEGQKNLEKAKEVYNNAVEAFPDNNDLRFNYAQFLADQENKEEAIAQLDKIAAGAEDDFMTYYQLFMMYSRLGAEEKAQSAMKEVQRISESMQSQSAAETDQPSSEDIQKEADQLKKDIKVETPVETENAN
ncbi:SurA N-terminal domain-containing protein [Halanaerobium kushneri]|uniref:peptidylprolyl isomerase n=1 Tax=Halanaerobium kushneri TaxID=56779 RepID=A0A1N6V8K4_9FIRM|nr:SurA N-terminal domain-containing protein [Halanaerobium kushneri]SIQ74211.1 Tetratricopeptide repeat-containing protein [Halanaerobium kushneri]